MTTFFSRQYMRRRGFNKKTSWRQILGYVHNDHSLICFRYTIYVSWYAQKITMGTTPQMNY